MRLPQLTDLPDENASLQEYGEFIDKFDPTEYFRNMWGDKYFDEVSERWKRQIKLFKNDKAPDTNIEESLMVLTFDYIMGSGIGIPLEKKAIFFQWLLSPVKTEKYLRDGPGQLIENKKKHQKTSEIRS